MTQHAGSGGNPPAQAAETPDGELRDFDSLVFSAARPALDEEVPLRLRPAVPEGLALPPPDPGGGAAVPREAPAVLPEGPLAGAPLPRLLAVLHAGRATGALSLRQGEEKKLLLLEDGALAFATSSVPAERFGARCVREGLIDAAGLDEIAAGGRPTSEALLAAGRLSAERRDRMVAEQAAEIVWSTFDWREGRYRLILGPLPHRERVRLAIATGELVLEGMRRVAALERLRAELPPELVLAPAPEPVVEQWNLRLRPSEAETLAHADGTKSVRDLVLLSGGAERETLAFLAACRHLGILDAADRLLAGTRRFGFM